MPFLLHHYDTVSTPVLHDLLASVRDFLHGPINYSRSTTTTRFDNIDFLCTSISKNTTAPSYTTKTLNVRTTSFNETTEAKQAAEQAAEQAVEDTVEEQENPKVPIAQKNAAQVRKAFDDLQNNRPVN
ncbi:unnamed protein product [Amoebophrya sp. A120]|nr:unnamed protein product [Amoebophrya sp. A120]|eukprot:GSA120T00013204001.1